MMRTTLVVCLALVACGDSHEVVDDAPGSAVDAPPDVPDAHPDAPPQPLVMSFASAVKYVSQYKPYVLRAVDIDRDGDVDLVVFVEETSTVQVLLNDGSGTFAQLAAPTPYGFETGTYPTGGAIADMDGDGVLDVITADYRGNSVSILRGRGSGATYTLLAHAAYPTSPGAETSNLAVGDWNRDGVLDVLATNPQRHSLTLFLGAGDGTLRTGMTIPLANPAGVDPPEPYAVVAGDFDRDGLLDAAIADNRSGKIFAELGRGDGTFREAPERPEIGGLFPYQIVAADLDRDGVLDLAVASRGSNNVSVLVGRGDGRFAAALVATTGANSGPYNVALADFDRDGILDVVTANSQSGNASILRGLGDGRLAAPFDAGPTGTNPYGVAAADFNGDGKPDFATANAVSNDVAVKLSTAMAAP